MEGKKTRRELYRLNTKIAAEITPLAGGIEKESFIAKIIDISGAGCKALLPTKDMQEFQQAIVKFALDIEPFKVYGEIVRWNKRKGIFAIKFTYLYDAPAPQEGIKVWLERRFLAWGLRKISELESIRKRNNKE